MPPIGFVTYGAKALSRFDQSEIAMRIGLYANFGSSFGVADRLGINSSAKVSPALGPGVGNRGADSDRITDRSTFVVGLIGSIRPDIAVRWFPRERLNLTRAVTRDWLNCR